MATARDAREGSASQRPGWSGTGSPSRTFLFTDIEGSTRRWEQRPDAMDAALALHDAVVAEVVASHRGRIFKHTGDGFAAVFEDPLDAVLSAVDVQRRLADEDFDDVEGLRVRTGIHTGEAVARDGDWFGPALNRSARLMGVAAGGQILASDEVVRRLGTAPADGLALRDLGEHVLRDLVGSERIHQVEAVGLPTGFPPLGSLSTYRTNLRPQLTSFVGREHERQHLRELLGRSSLVTVTGIGGGGKTRLALQTAGELLDAFPDGVFVIEFASLEDPWAVARTVATTVGCFDPLVEAGADDRERAAEATADHIARSLSSCSMLLVLDNCEHLLAPIRTLVGTLRRGCPQLVILTTSRTPLAVAGEQRFEIPPLGTGRDGEQLTSKAETQSSPGDAITLFRDRAMAVRSDFEITDANVAAVAEICHRLDGIPLALELAATKTTTLTPAQIAARLDDALAILQDRVGHERRHATLDQVLDWSYQQLGPREQRVLSRLSVFRGGCTLEAAEAVAGVEPLTASQVLPAIEELATRSLVRVDVLGEHARYHLLEPVRQFARARLAATAADEAQVRGAHVGWVLDRFRDARMVRNVTEELVGVLHADEDNLRAAYEWARLHGDQAMVRLVAYAFWYWRAQAEHTTSAAWAEEAIARLEPEPSPYLASALGMLAGVKDAMGETTRAIELFERSLQINEQLAYSLGTGWSAGMLARVHGIAGHLDDAERLFAYSQRHLERAGDGAGRSWSAINQAWISLWKGDPVRSRLLVDAILGNPEAAPDPAAMAQMLTGVMDLHEGREESGAQQLEEGLAAIVSTTDRAYALPFVARFELAIESRHDAGIEHLREAIELLRLTGQVAMLQFALEAVVCVDRVDVEAATTLLGAADRLYERLRTSHPGPAGEVVAAGRAAARGQLGDERFERLHEMGRRLEPGKAVDLALEQLTTRRG